MESSIATIATSIPSGAKMRLNVGLRHQYLQPKQECFHGQNVRFDNTSPTIKDTCNITSQRDVKPALAWIQVQMPPKRPKRPHSFGGCGSCRRRHLKCDQQTPTCDRCRRSGLTCDFAPPLRWLTSNGRDAFEADETTAAKMAAPYTKRHLYTGA